MKVMPAAPEAPTGRPDDRTQEAVAGRERPGPASVRGEIHGLPADRLLRLLGEERETCTVLVRSGDRVGFLYLVGGDLHDARTAELQGLHAAFRILSWDDASLELCVGEEDRDRTIWEGLDKVVRMASRARREPPSERPHDQGRGTGPAPDTPYAASLDETDPLLDLSMAPVRSRRDDHAPWQVARSPDAGAFDARGALHKLLAIPAEGAAIVDVESGMCLETAGDMPFFEMVAAMSVEILSVEQQVVRRMASRDRVEDVLVTLGHQHHVLRPIRHRDGFCLFVVFDRRMTKLAWARHRVAEIESRLRF